MKTPELSAFPLPLGPYGRCEPSESGGMSLRDYFAAKAMQSIIDQIDVHDGRNCGSAAYMAYRIAAVEIRMTREQEVFELMDAVRKHGSTKTNTEILEMLRFAVRTQQEPVAYIGKCASQGHVCLRDSEGMVEVRPLYATPVAPTVPQWQPIETAPKDRRDLILLLTPSRFPQVAYSNTWWTSGFSVENKPTHWMPLPALPSSV